MLVTRKMCTNTYVAEGKCSLSQLWCRLCLSTASDATSVANFLPMHGKQWRNFLRTEAPELCLAKQLRLYIPQNQNVYSICYYDSIVSVQCLLPDSYRGKFRGESAGSKYAEEVEEIITKLQSEGKKVRLLLYVVHRCFSVPNVPKLFWL